MSPEQLDGSDVDARSDIFALGVLLFELASAQHPFEAPTPGSTVAKVMAADPPPLVVVQPAAAAAARRHHPHVPAAAPHRSLRVGARRRPRPAGPARRAACAPRRRPPGRAVRRPARCGGGGSTSGAGWRSKRALVYGVWRVHVVRAQRLDALASSSPTSSPARSTARCARTCCSSACSTPATWTTSSAARPRWSSAPTWSCRSCSCSRQRPSPGRRRCCHPSSRPFAVGWAVDVAHRRAGL